ncbi:MAG: polyphosphate kinase 1 [Melioribacteraceae bacterium]|nr:polyphosphate kinase 1 [Melioribacteraceae bacterium]
MLKKENLKKYFKPENFFNRDISWVEFNRRVLDEALNPELPLLDRIKFISIFSSNLDEFYMIRISGLKEQIRAKVIETKIDGLNPIQELQKIEKEVQPMLKKIYSYWQETIIPELKENNVHLLKLNSLPKTEQEKLTNYFKREIYPVLTPLAFDPGRPFPYISNLSLSFATLVQKPSGEKHFARVKIPSILSRLLKIDDIIGTNKKKGNSKFSARFVWLGDIIEHNMHFLFPGMKVLESHRFRITRNTDLEIQEDEADDLLELIEENIKQRKFGSVVRLEIEKNMPEFMIETLTENLQIKSSDIHILETPLGLSTVMKLYDLPLPNLKEKPYHPVNPITIEEDENIFSQIKQKDIILHHPYDTFSPVIDFIKTATKDPDVLAIKQTLYRVGSNSPIVKALIEAAERGKQIAVLVELKARFDEENNIFWAKELEKAGVHVVYGLVGLKTHCKMTLVVRKESEGVKRYIHLGTGNYNATTAKVYTDLGLFTADEYICSDVSDLFNFLTGYSLQKNYNKLLVAPVNMKDKVISLIENEIKNVKAGNKGYIAMKLNSLVDPLIIAALYEASANGVKIDLIVRGICCLVPGKEGLSKNISVKSIVGRFLEHSRVYYFYNNGKESMYSGSADMMPRNLERRVEILFPIEDQKLKQKVLDETINIGLKDSVNSRTLLSDGQYITEKSSGKNEISSQEWLMRNNEKSNKKG